MFIVHMDIVAKAGLSEALVAAYREVLVPAIARQPGFSGTQLLQARAPEPQLHRLVIAFDSEELQKQWIATELHQEAWIQIVPHVASYSVGFFDTV